MRVSRNWLNNYLDGTLPDAQAIADALTFHAFEIESVEKTGDDHVLDVKVTPNRGHDCLSHRGIAKELSAILKLPLNTKYDPFAHKPVLSRKATDISVAIEDEKLCPRYIAAHITGIKAGPSPQWLSESLETIGQRSVNNVVDATNFVMFNIGQPLHAFDAKRLGGLNIGVRNAREGEEMEALDGKKYALKTSMLLITAADRPVGVAGIKGGYAEKIDEATDEILLESANFDGVSIRRSAQALKLRTDASSSFEQGLSPELAAYGMIQAVELIKAVAGGECQGYVDAYLEPQREMRVSVNEEKVRGVLGIELSGAEIADAFTRLGFAYTEEGGIYEVKVPFERLDLAIPEDLIEEVARIVGYDRIPAEPLPAFVKTPEINGRFHAAEQERERLVAEGYSEMFTSVFSEEGERTVANKADGVRPHLRKSLVQGLTEALKKNLTNKDLLGLTEVKLFEIGTVWAKDSERLMVGTITEKEKAQERELAAADAPKYDDLPLSATDRFEPFSKYPYIVRDVAVWVPAGTVEEDVEDLVRREAGPLLVSVRLFDRFEKEGRASLGFRLIYQSFERTLEDSEANRAMEKVYGALRARGYEIR